MSRPRKPTKVLELNGAFKHDPQRRAAREGEPEVTEPLGEPPACLNEAEAARWKEIADWCPWLTVADRVLVEQTCVLWTLARCSTTTLALLSSNLSKLGMTPVDRSKVGVPGGRTKKLNAFGALRA